MLCTYHIQLFTFVISMGILSTEWQWKGALPFSPLPGQGKYRKLSSFVFQHVTWFAAAAAKSHQSRPTLCDPIDGSPSGSPVPGILQARTLEWVAISFSNAWQWKVKVKSLSRVRLFTTPWTAAHQAPLSMGLSRQEYWSGVPLPSPMPQGGTSNDHSWQVMETPILHVLRKGCLSHVLGFRVVALIALVITMYKAMS